MPWSCAAGMRCAPISPFVDAPQMKKVRKRIQKLRVVATSRSTASAPSDSPSRNLLRPHRDTIADCTDFGATSAPYGRRPMLSGLSRSSHAASGISAATMPATISTAARHPHRAVTCASIGRKTSCPVDALAVRTPSTVPRRATNQRFTTVAASTTATSPVPTPMPEPPQRHQLPALPDQWRDRGADGEQRERRQHHASHADARHQRAGERSRHSI